MGLAERPAVLGIEALSLKVGLAHRALEALAVVVVVESFNPSVTCFNGEPTTHALRRE